MAYALFIAFGLMVLALSFLISHATLRIVAITISAILFLVAAVVTIPGMPWS